MWILSTHRVPLGQHPLLLEPGELPAVVDGGEDLPHQDEGQTDGNDGADHTEDNAYKDNLLHKASS